MQLCICAFDAKMAFLFANCYILWPFFQVISNVATFKCEKFRKKVHTQGVDFRTVMTLRQEGYRRRGRPRTTWRRKEEKE